MIEIIPAIDLIEGRCVRLTKGDYERCRRYDADPRAVAEQLRDCGCRRLHVVDLDGAKASEPRNLRTVERLAAVAGLQIEFGGGIKTDTALRDAFNAGAAYAVVGSVAVREPQRMQAWLAAWGGERMVLGADVREGHVAVQGWTQTTADTVEALTERFLPCGLTQMICTDIARDGMLGGVDVQFYQALQQRFASVAVTVSGGISSMDDILALETAALRRVIVGKALYEGRITYKDLEQWWQNA